VLIMHLYDRALLNRAALNAVGYTRDTPKPARRRNPARFERQAHRAAHLAARTR
jgi:predicted amidohydrolase YtcJ